MGRIDLSMRHYLRERQNVPSENRAATVESESGGPRSRVEIEMVRILLADDHIVVRSGLRTFLEARADFSICAEASNGRDAVDLAVRKKPDVAILDITLPVLNGVEATRQIRKGVPE